MAGEVPAIAIGRAVADALAAADVTAAIGAHRHTMCNRMATVADLLGRDVEPARVRAELWLAVKARELVQLGG